MDGSDKTIEALREAVEEIMVSYLQDFKMDLYVTLRNELQHQLSSRSRIEPLMSIKEVAQALNVSVRTMEDILIYSNIETVWIGGQRRFRPDQVRAFIESPKRKSKGYNW